jgi:hypothetical protein
MVSVFPVYSGRYTHYRYLVLLRDYSLEAWAAGQSMARGAYGAEAFQNTDPADRYRAISWCVNRHSVCGEVVPDN